MTSPVTAQGPLKIHKVGDRICWGGNDSSGTFIDPNNLREGTITKVGRMYGDTWYWVDGHHKDEDAIYPPFAFPIEAMPQLQQICADRQRLKKAYDDSIALIFQLRNRYVLKESPPAKFDMVDGSDDGLPPFNHNLIR